jgi:DNA-binding SARP family transcriptional activator
MTGELRYDAHTVAEAPVRLCLLGGFRLLKGGRPVGVRPGSKTQVLLGYLGLRHRAGIPRDELVGLIWPSAAFDLAGQSLNTLVYSLHRLLGDALAGHHPVLHEHGVYRLNTERGIVVDVARFDAAVDRGDLQSWDGDRESAIRAYGGAAEIYVGDLSIGWDVQQVVERERLRGRYLHTRSRLADHEFARGRYSEALAHALDVLANDPCREDAHRMAMRAYVRLGERSQALRQYQLCRKILDREFEAVPETETEALYELVRLTPSQV